MLWTKTWLANRLYTVENVLVEHVSFITFGGLLKHTVNTLLKCSCLIIFAVLSCFVLSNSNKLFYRA